MRAEQRSVISAVAGRLIGEGIVVLALLAWWALSRGLPEFILPGPVPVARRLVELFMMPDFLWHLFTSTWRVLGLDCGGSPDRRRPRISRPWRCLARSRRR